jgi:predicted amidohydrolase
MRIAVAQAPGVALEAWRETWSLVDVLLAEAARQRAELVVLPECVWPAYCLGSRETYHAARSMDLPAPDTFVRHLQERAQNHGLAICAGYVDEQDGELLNAAVLITRTGRIAGRTAKCFLWAFDRGVFTPGHQLNPIDLDGLPVGVLICADARMPEIPATLAAGGAQLLLQPTAWVNGGTTEVPWNPQPAFLIRARAAEFGIPCASASKWGRELETDFVGQSLICDGSGTVLARCGASETHVVVAEVQPAPPRRPIVYEAERLQLLGTTAPARPASDVPDVTVHLGAVPALKATDEARGLRLCLPHPDRPVSAQLQPDLHTLVLRGPADESVCAAGVCFAARPAAEAARFAALRALALQGCHAVVLFGADVDRVAVQARACENRFYVVWVREADVWFVDPRGLIIAKRPWEGDPSPVTLAVSVTADKEVAWKTDIVHDRQPAQYAF